nr:hypothetical protein [Tanacetum cinerariifolium]
MSLLQEDISSIKSMMTKMYNAFRGQSSSAPSSSVTPTFSLTDTLANLEGDNATHTATKEPPHTEGKTDANIQDKPEEPKQSVDANIEKMHYLTNDEISEHLEKEELIKKAAEQARLLVITKPEVIKLVREEAEKIRIDSERITSAKEGEKFKKAQDAQLKVLNKEKKRYERIKKILGELRIQSALPSPILEQALSKSLGRKRKHIELEPEVKVHGLDCDRSLPEGLPFVNNMVIEEPEYGIFFTNMFGDQAFQRWNDIHKVGVVYLVSYLVMASMIKTQKNAMFSLKLRKLTAEHPDQEKLKSKRVKLEALGYKLD